MASKMRHIGARPLRLPVDGILKIVPPIRSSITLVVRWFFVAMDSARTFFAPFGSLLVRKACISDAFKCPFGLLLPEKPLLVITPWMEHPRQCSKASLSGLVYLRVLNSHVYDGNLHGNTVVAIGHRTGNFSMSVYNIVLMRQHRARQAWIRRHRCTYGTSLPTFLTLAKVNRPLRML